MIIFLKHTKKAGPASGSGLLVVVVVVVGGGGGGGASPAPEWVGGGGVITSGALWCAAAEHPCWNRDKLLFPQMFSDAYLAEPKSLRLLLPSALSHRDACFNHLEFS